MVNGLLYKPEDEELINLHIISGQNMNKLNHMDSFYNDDIKPILKKWFKSFGDNSALIPPFYTDYGVNISVGNNSFINMNATFLDVCEIKIGNNVFIGPNVSLYTPCHPIHKDYRYKGLEYGKPITIEDNVWIGGNVIILPGVTIKNGAVIGAGSVVTKDVEEDTIVAGNPAKFIRKIDEKDKLYWEKRFEEEK